MRREVLGLLGAVLVMAPTAPMATADEPGLELSRDGRTWSSTLSGPVLDEDARLAPGGSTRSDVWVRNSSDRTTTLTTVARSRTTLPADVAPRDDFRVRVGASRVRAGQVEDCRVLTTHELGPGDRQRLPVAVSLPQSSRTISEDESVTLGLRVHLVEGGPGDPCDDDNDGGTGGGDDDGGGGSGDSGGGGDDAAVSDPTPQTPGVVGTDGGPGERPALTDALVLALGLLAAVVAEQVRRRGRARREPPAS